MLITRYADATLRSLIPAYQNRRKHGAEVRYWRSELEHLRAWFVDRSTDWWGIRAPTDEQRVSSASPWSANAVLTMHSLRASYLEELRIERDHFRGMRVLEIGCGPLAPILQFDDCERHGIDPLIDVYLQSGWPLYAYDAKLLNCHVESLPYPDSYFDAAISVNALDHVDDFEQAAAEIQRVVRPGGVICFEVEYHSPSVTEPMELSDERVRSAFRPCDISKVIDRPGSEMYKSLVCRFDLLPNQFRRFANQRFVTWHCVRH